MITEKYSKDPKVQLISIEDFLINNNYLIGITQQNLWNDTTIPSDSSVYYKLTPNFLICISYGTALTNFGMDYKEKLEYIQVAYRDGKTEYQLFNRYIENLIKEKTTYENSKLDTEIKKIKKAIKLLPEYQPRKTFKSKKTFDSYIIDSGYKTNIDNLKNKYLVFDVETNGLRKSNDDLLSLSIYDPTTGECYNRFFPLDLQPLVMTTFIHGITDETLTDAIHMDQKELDNLIEHFNMKNKILLSYSGGKGTFDVSFVINYCKRHNLKGFETLHFENIKNKIPDTPFGCEGYLTKDNLCRLFEIEGVNKVHSSYNDCILEWKLFEKISSEPVFFIGEHLFKYHSDYVIPVSYLSKYKALATYAGINIPNIQGEITELYHLHFPNKIMKKIEKFPTNITGIAIENGINKMLNAKKQDNFEFLKQNKSHLEYIGTLDSKMKIIPVIAEDDGTMKAINQQDEEYIKRVNRTTKIIVDYIKPLAKFIKNNILTTNKIKTQEMCLSDDGKVLALCDLSDETSVIEIKTYNVLKDNNYIKNDLALQLYYQANGRKTYVLSLVFDTHINETYESIVDNLNLYLYQVILSSFDPYKIIRQKELNNDEKIVLDLITKNVKITKTEIKNQTNISQKYLNFILSNLENFKYIKKDNPNSRKSPWIILRNSNDPLTQYIFDGQKICIIENTTINSY